MRDIETKEDLAFLMREFYSTMLVDETIGYIFTDVAELDLEEHLPSLTNFWENMLFKSNGYKKDVMGIHLLLNGKEKLKPEHFERWLFLLDQTVRANFEGDRVERMLTSAKNIGAMMRFKLGK
tara:strand:- start:374 stop:742 length:369 start_codon:yes stop_codon:yes gene_type:complete